jgi:7-carboxy-7-deazaguanine synthase
LSDVHTLKVAELFHSLQGEGLSSGLPTSFVRLSGCNLRCGYCDTTGAQTTDSSTLPITITTILEKLSSWNCLDVMVTGGEPLAQNSTLHLLYALLERGFRVVLETNGSLDLADVPAAVVRSVDVKTPGSGEVDSFHLANLKLLQPDDQLKFVCVDEDDIEWSLAFIRQHRLTDSCAVILQPGWESVSLQLMARQIIASGLPVRLGLQLHKIIWGGNSQGV